MSKQRILYEEQRFTFFIMHQLLSQRFDSLLAKPSLSAAWCHAGGPLQGFYFKFCLFKNQLPPVAENNTDLRVDSVTQKGKRRSSKDT